MNHRRAPAEQGIALITTLIMLSVVTLMAVTFLAVSRRERAAVATSSDRLDARAMAEAALQRAEAEVISRVLATTNLLSYDLLVSTNYQNPDGFVRGNTNIANVSFRYGDGTPVTGDDLHEVYRNLQVDPRVPVFVVTNVTTGGEDFRYYLDFNRNGRFETNGVQIELVGVGREGIRPGFTNFHIGDPEWIGILRRPDQPHSGSNHFVGRMAFLIQPAGKSLDLNFIHNQAKRIGAAVDGFHRNQGVGSWEQNLAAFLYDLNTNYWAIGYDYFTNLANPSRGIAFENARTLLRYRFRTNATDSAPVFGNLSSARDLFGTAGATAFERDGIDGYSDGNLQLELNRPTADDRVTILENDIATRPWSGAENPSQYFDPQELFTISESAINEGTPQVDQFTNRLIRASLDGSTYDRHTFYRLLGQLGTDSVPNNRERIHLNYDNRLDFDPRLAGLPPDISRGFHTTNFVPWTPIAFFTNAADRILKELHPPAAAGFPLVSVTNIQVWPTNYYSPAVHRALQVAANIYDSTTNRVLTDYPQLPSVFRPVFGPDPTVPNGLRIAGYEELTDNWEALLWNTAHYDIDESESRPNIRKYERVAGIPIVIGAKKGFPNFNEIELQTRVVAGRKLELIKRSPTSRPNSMGQLYTVGISNVFGVEFWNSYDQPFARPLELRARLEFSLVLSNQARVIRELRGVVNYVTNFPANTWAARGTPGEFKLPIYTNVLFLPVSAFRNADGQFYSLRTNTLRTSLFDYAPGLPPPIWRLNITNRLQAVLVDRSVGGGRIVDYVDLDNLVSQLDITKELFGEQDLGGQTSTLGSFWKTNLVQGGVLGTVSGSIPEGVANQIQASLGQINVAQWNSVSAEPLQGLDKEKAIDRFRQFMGLSPQPAQASPTLRMQAPFSPGIQLAHNKSWQVNDPLVNDLFWDLWDPSRSNVTERLPPLFTVTSERSNLEKINQRYRPWQRGQYSSGDQTDFDLAVKDPQVTRSDDWDFPTNTLPSLGWLGRVHRGTPWQTLYLKSKTVDPQRWLTWSGHPEWNWGGLVIPLSTQPTNDWRILDLFTTAVSDNAARGQLSVNQTGLAAWSAVLSGVPVLTNQIATNLLPVLIAPNSHQLHTIVDGINIARAGRFAQKFNYLGEILSTPELTDASPYLLLAPTQNGAPADAAVERIPQMVLSLLKRDEPRFVVFAYGQSLKPAPGSVITDFGPFFQMPTNYTITGEYVTKTLMRLEEFIDATNSVTGEPIRRIRAIKEAYNEVPPAE